LLASENSNFQLLQNTWSLHECKSGLKRSGNIGLFDESTSHSSHAWMIQSQVRENIPLSLFGSLIRCTHFSSNLVIVLHAGVACTCIHPVKSQKIFEHDS
jgi:hypothetical protein